MRHWYHDFHSFVVFAEGERGENGGIFDGWFFVVLMMILVMFYLMVVMPQRRKQREAQDMLQGLKENERVVTIGGIIGSIVSFSKDGSEVVLRIDEKTNAKMRVLRSAIARPLKAEGEAGGEGEGKELGKSG